MCIGNISHIRRSHTLKLNRINFKPIIVARKLRSVNLNDSVTTMIGGNGSGKTAALVALSRLFGINRSQRSILKTDFHLGKDDAEIADGAMLYIEAILAFPELGEDGANDPGAVAEFWRQMAATEDGNALKARVRLQATWVEDGTPDGLQSRWSQVHAADTDTEPVLRLVEGRFESLVGQAEIRFKPDEAGLERELDRLSDGQKSLFQIALTAATLEVEQDAAALDVEDCPFDQSLLRRVPLTILAIEEPENSLSPFFLSRIMQLANDIGEMSTAQVMIASHSSSILSRVAPESIRYFRQDQITARSSVRELTLPESESDEGAYVRLAVRAYPELYFARFVILAEGDSEQLIIPRIAEVQDIALDRSFVPIVPLGGRYVSHFWRLLKDLEIPHATLLDLDLGRQHGGANNRKRTVLKKNGNPGLYPNVYDLDFAWYPYLFMQSSKPDTHLAAISKIEDDILSDDCPEELDTLLKEISKALEAEYE